MFKSIPPKNRKYLKKGSIKSTRNFFGVRYSGNFVLIQDYLKSMIKETGGGY